MYRIGAFTHLRTNSLTRAKRAARLRLAISPAKARSHLPSPSPSFISPTLSRSSVLNRSPDPSQSTAKPFEVVLINEESTPQLNLRRKISSIHPEIGRKNRALSIVRFAPETDEAESTKQKETYGQNLFLKL